MNEYRPQAEAIIAAECGLRISNRIPHIITGEGFHSFPMAGNTVFVLENDIQFILTPQKKLRNFVSKQNEQMESIIENDRFVLRKKMKAKVILRNK